MMTEVLLELVVLNVRLRNRRWPSYWSIRIRKERLKYWLYVKAGDVKQEKAREDLKESLREMTRKLQYKNEKAIKIYRSKIKITLV